MTQNKYNPEEDWEKWCKRRLDFIQDTRTKIDAIYDMAKTMRQEHEKNLKPPLDDLKKAKIFVFQEAHTRLTENWNNNTKELVLTLKEWIEYAESCQPDENEIETYSTDGQLLAQNDVAHISQFITEAEQLQSYTEEFESLLYH